MLEDHKDILKNSIKDMLSMQEKFSDFEIDSNFQSQISQLDLFKVIASLEIGIIGIGYLYNSKIDGVFLLLSLFFALLTLVMSISYTREVIDIQPKLNSETHAHIAKKVQEHNEVVFRAFKEDNSDIYFNYARTELEKKFPELPLTYISAIIILFFYLSIGFLGLSFVSYKYSIKLISVPSLLLLVVVYLASFKSWTIWLSNKFSTPCNKLFQKKLKSDIKKS